MVETWWKAFKIKAFQGGVWIFSLSRRPCVASVHISMTGVVATNCSGLKRYRKGSTLLFRMPPAKKKTEKIQIVGGGETVLRDYHTLVSQTVLKQLQMQPFKRPCNPCTLWGIHLPDIVLPWQKSSFQNRPFTHKLQFSFKARHYFFQEKVSLQNTKQSSKYAAFLSVEVWPDVACLPFILALSLPSIIQYVFQNIRFLHSMQCVIDIQYCCQKVQWSIHIAAFVETRKILLKECAAYRLQSAFYSLK